MKHCASAFTLPCGTVLSNRIAKSALSENIGSYSHAPTPTLIQAYRVWASGHPGLLITGNIMVDKRALGEPRNVVVEDYTHFDQLKEWANAIKGTEVHLWPQINHPGRQAFSWINKEVVAPSKVSIKLGERLGFSANPNPLKNLKFGRLLNALGIRRESVKKQVLQVVKSTALTGIWSANFSRPSPISETTNGVDPL